MSKTNTIFYTNIAKEHSKCFSYSYTCTYILGMISKYLDVSLTELLKKFQYDLFLVKPSKLAELNDLIQKQDLSCYFYHVEQYLNVINDKRDSFDLNALKNINYTRDELVKIAKALDNEYLINTEFVDTTVDEITLQYIFNLFVDKKHNLYNLLHLVDESNYDRELYTYFDDLVLLKLFVKLNLKKIRDLLSMDLDLLCILFSKNFEKLEKMLIKLNLNVITIFEEDIEYIENKLCEKNNSVIDIIQKRNGFYGDEMTLEEIGNIYKVTRERIRQIEAKAYKTIQEDKIELSSDLHFYLLKILNNEGVLNFDLINNNISRRNIGYLKILVKTVSDDWKYSNEYNCIYYGDSLRLVEDSCLQNLPKYIGRDEYNKLSIIEKKVVDNNYYLNSKNFYRRKGMNLSEVYAGLVDEYFPNGILINKKNTNVINEVLVSKYGMETIEPHALSANLQRIDYCQINKGTFVNRNKVPILEKEFILEIIDSMLELGSIVYYSSIYDLFREEFNKIGVNNRYFVKGVLDRELPESFTTKRDYVMTDDSFRSSADGINQFVTEQQEYIDLVEMRKKFPNVKDYVFVNNMVKRNDIVYCGGTKYIKINLEKLNNYFKDYAINEIEFLFNKMNTNSVSINKLYSRIRINNPELLGEHRIIDSFTLFSVLEKILKDKYFFRRPYISNEKEDLNTEAIIRRYIDKLNSFNNRTINDFVSKMNMRGLYSYQEFMIDSSDNFVQINIDTCVKKEMLELTSDVLEKIRKELNYYVDSFGKVDLSNTSIYQYLPKIKCLWNKYLLVGVIRTYFKNVFDIEYTDNQYQKTNFIIKKGKK